MDLIISSPTENIEYHNLKQITLPSLSGEIQILQNYAETFLFLRKGKLIFQKHQSAKKEILLSSNTQCHIKDNIIIILK